MSFGRQCALFFSTGQQQAPWNAERVHGDHFFGESLDESKGISKLLCQVLKASKENERSVLHFLLATHIIKGHALLSGADD